MTNNQTKHNLSFDTAWQLKFNELCHAVFLKNPTGEALLRHMELKYFRSPVAIPGKEPSWAYFNEGRNELIRSFSTAIQLQLNREHKPGTPKTIKRTMAPGVTHLIGK